MQTKVWEVMQYYFCPRCKFRMIAVKKHICPTCGFKLPRIDHAGDSSNSDTSERQTERPAVTPRFWSKLFKLEFDAGDSDAIEST